MNAEERMRIADDLHQLLNQVALRTSQIDARGDDADDEELRYLHQKIAGMVGRYQQKFPQECRVRTPDEVQLIEQKRSPGDVGASRSAAKEG